MEDTRVEDGAPSTVVVNLPRVAGLTVPAGGAGGAGGAGSGEADAAPPQRDWYFWFSKLFPAFGFGFALFICARTLILGNISTQVAITLWITILTLVWSQWMVMRGPKYRGMAALLAQTEPGQIRIKSQVFNRESSVLVVSGVFGQCIGMLYSEAGKPRTVVPSYFAVTMLPQLLRRWSEPRVTGPVGATGTGIAGR